ncbi:trypsin-like serine peptidase [Actinokineospora cianjurensis]|uniref:Trypsin-like peptidase n=1 Tax=Actinokineospora cianjurensis TaxID=585224 RepID=A0A421AZM6_9PSEU|nr:serine protease [Actinokineospora cianjurensis]RLK55317.1 trypsin-like peptidase [Actinokineospora cianjurensis]
MLRRLIPAAVLVAAVLGPAPPVGAAELGEPVAAPISAESAAGTRVTKTGVSESTDTAIRYGNTGNSWRTEIKAAGATYVKVHFAPLKLVGGDFVTVASPDGREVYTYYADRAKGSPFTEHGGPGFAAMSIDGDTAVVTLHATGARDGARLSRQGYGTRVTSYDRGYGATEYAAQNPVPFSVCGNDARKDVVCYQNSHPTEYARSHAVARQLVNGLGSCTAWRVGNTNRMLTNAHCVADAAELRSSEFQFDYQCATCGGNNPRTGTKVSGQDLIRTSELQQLDYTLFSVTNFESIRQYGTLYLDVREPTANERIYIAGHGDILPKRMSLFEESDGGATCKIDVVSSGVNTGYRCDSSGGNSGSPVLAGSSHKVIALHHLGGCPNWGTRITLVYNEIRNDIDNTSGGGNTPVLSLNPTSGTAAPGTTTTATLQTPTVAGNPTLTLSATGAPAGTTTVFSPSAVTAGQPSTLTITVGSTTAPGTYTITASATGATTAPATYTLTVPGGQTPCQGMKVTKTGTLSTGASQYQPDGSFFQTTVTGPHKACLTGPTSANFDLYLQKWNGSTWPTVAQATTSGSSETLSYNGTAGYYRYQVKSVTGSGQYTLGYTAP